MALPALAVLGLLTVLPTPAESCIRRLVYLKDLPYLSVEGCNSHYQLGLIQGTTFGGLIRARVADSDVLQQVLEYIQTERGAALFSDMRAYHESAYPWYWQELLGLSAGSKLPIETILALNLRNELLAASRLDPAFAADASTAASGAADAAASENEYQRTHRPASHTQQHTSNQDAASGTSLAASMSDDKGCSDVLVSLPGVQVKGTPLCTTEPILVETSDCSDSSGDDSSHDRHSTNSLDTAGMTTSTTEHGHRAAAEGGFGAQDVHMHEASDRHTMRPVQSAGVSSQAEPLQSSSGSPLNALWSVLRIWLGWQARDQTAQDASQLQTSEAAAHTAHTTEAASHTTQSNTHHNSPQHTQSHAVSEQGPPRNEGYVTTLLGHNEDVSSDVVGRMYLLKAQLVGHPAWVALVYPGELASTAFGTNAAGVAFTLDALYPTQPFLPGVGRNWLSRAMLEATDIETAETLLYTPGQATGRCINLLNYRTCDLTNTEIAPGGDTDTLAVNTGANEWTFHANAYQRMDVPEQSGPSSRHREAAARHYATPTNAGDVLDLLGDETDERWPIYRTGPSDKSKDPSFTAFTVLLTAVCSTREDTAEVPTLETGRALILQGNPRQGDVLLTLDAQTLQPVPA